MSDLLWRRTLVGLWLFAVVELLAAMIMQAFFFAALPGVNNYFTFAAPAERLRLDPIAPNLYRITAERQSVAYREGARTGDLLDARALAPSRRFRIVSGFWWPNESVTLPLTDATGATKHIALTAVRSPGTSDMWIANAGLCWMLLFAGIIIWRRPDAPQARTLSLLLILFNIGLNFQVQNWDTPWPLLDAGLSAFSGFPFFLGMALFATYAGLFARPLSRLRTSLALIAYVFALAMAITNAVIWVQSASSGVSPSEYAILIGNIQYLVLLLPLPAVMAALFKARGAEREQLAWASVSLMPMYLIYAAANLSPDPTFLRVQGYALNVSFALAPLGLTYSLLNRRLLDIGFAINRVAVFSVVSIVVVGAFVLVEWGLTELVGGGRNENVIAAAALTLVLGFSMRFIHNRVDYTLDRVFFKKRHEDEHAIRAYAHEAAYITNAESIVSRAIEVLDRHADASFTELSLDDGFGSFGSIDENDPAIVALRAWHRPVDLATLHTAVRGEFAYPMVARGHLVGALAIGPKRSGESYAPDEAQAIAELAHGVGLALDSLRSAAPNRVVADAVTQLANRVTLAVEAMRASSSEVAELKGLILRAMTEPAANES